MLQAALGHRVSSALASQLHQLVGGSPTLLQAVVSEQIERGQPRVVRIRVDPGG